MKKTLACVVAGWALLTTGSAMLAAPEQDRAGQMTQAKVWIENRGKGEALPTSLQDVAGDLLLRVQVTGIPTVAVDRSSVVQTRPVRQSWEYRTVTVASGQDPVSVLSTAGQDGWETTGLQVPLQGSSVALILKRPR